MQRGSDILLTNQKPDKVTDDSKPSHKNLGGVKH